MKKNSFRKKPKDGLKDLIIILFKAPFWKNDYKIFISKIHSKYMQNA